jgi:hypothetical protein
VTNFPDAVDSLPDPVGGDALALSNGKPHSVHHKDLNDAVEALERQGVGPVYENALSATASPAIRLANCTSLTADGPLSPPAVWTSYGQYGTTGPVRSITGGYVQAVFSGPNNGWLVCNLGADYAVPDAVALKVTLSHTRNPALTDKYVNKNLKVLISDAPFTGVDRGTSEPIIAGNTVETSPYGSGDGVPNHPSVTLGTLTKVRSIAFLMHDMEDYTSITLQVQGIDVRATTELEAALGSGPAVVPANYVPSGTYDQSMALGRAGFPAIDLRPGYQIIYNYGGEHHMREIQASGLEDGSALADYALQRISGELQPHEKLVFPPGASYLVQNHPIFLHSQSDIEIDFNGARFFKDATTFDADGHYIALRDTSRVKLHGFHLFGYRQFSYSGSQWVATTGTAVVGTARTFTALNHTAYIDTSGDGGGNGVAMQYLARDKDGNFSATFTLSDSAQVPKDCRIYLQTDRGTTVGYRDLTLTSTPTSYEVKIASTKFLHKGMRWLIKKMTATANTITLTTSTLRGVMSSAGGGPPWETQIGCQVWGRCSDVEVYDFTAEGLTSYVVNIGASDGYGVNIDFHDWSTRCTAVQGFGIVRASGPVRLDRFRMTEVNGNGIDLEAEVGVIDGVNITNGYFENIGVDGYSAFVGVKWFCVKDLVVDNIKGVNCNAMATAGFGAIGGSVTNCDFSKRDPQTNDYAGRPNNVDLQIAGQNMLWSNIHLSGGFNFMSAFSAFGSNPEDGWRDDGLALRYYELGNNVVENIFIDSGPVSGSVTPFSYLGSTPSGNVITDGYMGSNTLRNIVFSSMAPLQIDSIRTPSFIYPAMPEYHGIEGRPWQRAVPYTYRAASVGTPEFVPGGIQAFSQPIYDVQALSGGTATPVTWLPGGTTVAPSTVAGTPTQVTGLPIAVAPDGLVEANCELAAPGIWSTGVPGGSSFLGVTFGLQGSTDGGMTWYTLTGAPSLHLPGFRRLRAHTGPHTLVRAFCNNYSLGTIATVSMIGNWVGSRGRNLRMLNVPVTAAATTLAVTFPNQPTPPNNTWTATASTGGTLAAGTYTYRVGVKSIRSGAGVPDTAKSATVGANGLVELTADVGIPDEGWLVSTWTVFRKNPGDTNYTQRANICLSHPLFNYRPKGGLGNAQLEDHGAYVGFGSGFSSAGGLSAPWATIPGGGYSSAQLDTHNESGWEPDTNYGVQITPSWGTTAWVTAKREDGFDLAFGSAAPGGGGTVDLFFVR